MAENEQFSITLDAYHRWAMERIAEAMSTKRTDLIQQAVREYVARYPDTVASAKATLADFMKSNRKGKS